jgi:hypothetical protein
MKVFYLFLALSQLTARLSSLLVIDSLGKDILMISDADSLLDWMATIGILKSSLTYLDECILQADAKPESILGSKAVNRQEILCK